MAKSFKRTLIATLGVLFLVVTALAFAACSTKSFKVTLDFESTQGSVVLDPEADGNTYAADTEVKVTVTPNTGYEVDTFLVNGTAATLDANSSYTFKVEKDTTVAVTFKVTTYTITLSNDTNKGTVTLDKSGPLASGTEVKGTIAPKAAYDVDSVKVNDTPVTVANDLTFTFTVNGPTAVNVVYKDAEPGFMPPIAAEDFGTYASADGAHIFTVASDVMRYDGNVLTVKKYHGNYTVVIDDVEYGFAQLYDGILTIVPMSGEEDHVSYYIVPDEPFAIDAHLNGTWTEVVEEGDEPAYTVVIADGAAKINGEATKVLVANVDEALHDYGYYLMTDDGSIYLFLDYAGVCMLSNEDMEVYLEGNHAEVVIDLSPNFVGKWRGVESTDLYTYVYVLDFKSRDDIELKFIDYDNEEEIVFTLVISEVEDERTFTADSFVDGEDAEYSWRISIGPDGNEISISENSYDLSCNMTPTPTADGKITEFPSDFVFDGKHVTEDGANSISLTSDTLTLVLDGTTSTVKVADVTVTYEDMYGVTGFTFTVGSVEYTFSLFDFTLTAGDDEPLEFVDMVTYLPASWRGTYTNDDGTYALTITAEGITDVKLNGQPAVVSDFTFEPSDYSADYDEISFTTEDGATYSLSIYDYDSDTGAVYKISMMQSYSSVAILTDASKVPPEPPYGVDIDAIPEDFISIWYAFIKDDEVDTYLTGDVLKLVITANKIVITLNDEAPTTISVADIKFHESDERSHYSDALLFTYDGEEIELRYSSYELNWRLFETSTSLYYFTEDPVIVYEDPDGALDGISGNWKDDTYRVDIADGVVTLYDGGTGSEYEVIGLVPGTTDTVALGSVLGEVTYFLLKLDTAKLVLTDMDSHEDHELLPFTISKVLPAEYRGTWRKVGNGEKSYFTVSDDGTTVTYHDDTSEGSIDFEGIDGIYTFGGYIFYGDLSLELDNKIIAIVYTSYSGSTTTTYFAKDGTAVVNTPTGLNGQKWTSSTYELVFDKASFAAKITVGWSVTNETGYIYSADESTHTYIAYSATAKYTIVYNNNSLTVNGAPLTFVPPETIDENGLSTALYGTWSGRWIAKDTTYTLEISADGVYLTVDNGARTKATISAIGSDGRSFTLTANNVTMEITSSDDVSHLTTETPGHVQFSRID